MNFTWFASAYDTDDVPYRLMTLLQMGGVLVLAAGVPAAFDNTDFTAIIVGYIVMRLAQVGQWTRAAIEHPEGRATATRYAVGVGAVQVVWIAWGFLPEQARPWTFIVAAALELLVPIWAERPGMTSWHPHHIAERYGLFTIILLGESVSASAIGVQSGLEAHGVSPALVVIAAAGLVLLFALWWLYFLEPAGEGLESRRNRSFYWGYGHYFVFASLAAIGAGLEVAVQRGAAHADASDAAVEYAIAIPVAVFLLMGSGDNKKDTAKNDSTPANTSPTGGGTQPPGAMKPPGDSRPDVTPPPSGMGPPAGMGPPGPGGMRRIPIVLRLGRTEQRAWLNLRDCHVEKDPSLPNVPVVTVEGLDVWPVPGQDPPELQIRNARIRF